jgi:hypothetical protein
VDGGCCWRRRRTSGGGAAAERRWSSGMPVIVTPACRSSHRRVMMADGQRMEESERTIRRSERVAPNDWSLPDRSSGERLGASYFAAQVEGGPRDRGRAV